MRKNTLPLVCVWLPSREVMVAGTKLLLFLLGSPPWPQCGAEAASASARRLTWLRQLSCISLLSFSLLSQN